MAEELSETAILERVQAIARDLLDDPAIVLTEGGTVDGIPGWDSGAHLEIMLAIEDAFSIRFTEEELSGFATLGELVRRVQDLAEAPGSPSRVRP